MTTTSRTREQMIDDLCFFVTAVIMLSATVYVAFGLFLALEYAP